MNQKPIKEVEEEQKDEGSGMDDFLAKPLDPNALKAVFERHGPRQDQALIA
jgi:CheY-like chemotaxis protein